MAKLQSADQDPSGSRPQSGLAQSGLDRNQHARQLFDGITVGYDFLSQSLSLFQTGVWRRFLVSRLPAGAPDRVLDICTGTGGVALDIARKSGAGVVGLDFSQRMRVAAKANVAKAGMAESVSVVGGRAESLCFKDSSFDGVCFTYLLRYVEDPANTLREIARVLKPGGTLVSLGFGVPENFIVHAFWNAYTRLVLPLSTRFVSPGWRYVGSFLGPSIARFYETYSLEDVRRRWVDAGISGVQIRKLTWGGGIVMWGTKPA